MTVRDDAIPRGLEQLASSDGDWRAIADKLWRARLGWPQSTRRLAMSVRERTMRRGDAVDTARIDLVLLSIEQFERQSVRAETAYASDLGNVFRAAGDACWLALAKLHLARDAFMGGIESAESAMRQWIDHDSTQADELDQSWACATLGGLLIQKGDEEAGFRLRYESVECLRRQPPSPESAFALMNLGVTHHRFGNLRTAESLLEDAFQVAQTLGMTESYFLITGNVASVQLELGQPERALSTLAVAANVPNGTPYRSLYETMMGDALRAAGRHGEAREWLDRALKRIGEENSPQLRWMARIVELSQLRAEGRLDEALSLLRTAESTPPPFENPADALRICSEAAALFAEREEWEHAYAYERRHRDAYLELQRHAARVERFALQARYDLYRNQVERDFERRRREEAELARSTVQTLNEDLSTRLREIEMLQSALQEQVITDPLTGLYNRRFLGEVLPRELERAARDSSPVSVAILDVDGFKGVNDLHGHALGDDVLRRLSALLKDKTRATDYCCRFGGEEFCIVLTGIGADPARERLAAILDDFAALVLATQTGTDLRGLSFSCGVAAYPAHASHVEALLTLADGALLRAKRAGKRRVYVCEPALDRPGAPG